MHNLYAVSFIRSYATSAKLPTELPAEWHPWFNSRYRARNEVGIERLLDLRCGIQPPGEELHMTRWAVAHRSLQAVDCILEIVGDLPVDWWNEHRSLNPKDILLHVNGTSCSVSELLDRSLSKVTGGPTGDWPYDRDAVRKMFFGSIGFAAFGPIEGACVEEADLNLGPHRVLALTTSRLPLSERCGLYTVAALGGRERMKLEEIRDQIREIAFEVRHSDRTPTDLLSRSIQLQSEAIIVRHETAASLVLGGDRLLSHFEKIRDSAVISQNEQAEFNISLESLRELSEALFSLRVDEAGRQFGVLAVVFAAISVIFGGIAVVELARAERAVEYAAVAVAWVTVSFVILGALIHVRRRT